jgi:F-type H+-transporting ATPase subunit b
MENLLEDRRKEISDGLEAASQSQRKLEEANTESSKILDEAKAEASNLINQAGSRGDQIIDEAKNQAVEEQKKIKASAEADIEQNINKAKEGLKQEVSALVIVGAEQILNKEVDEKANKEIVEKLIKEL